MNEAATALILNIVGVVISTVIVAIGFLLKRSISDKLDGLDVKMQKIDDSVMSMKVEMLKEYVRKDEYVEANRDLREDVRELEIKLAKMDKAS